MQKVADIIANPAEHFDGPIDLAKAPHLPADVKDAALANWEKDVEALDVATDEGMAPPPDERPIHAELHTAFEIVGKITPTEVKASQDQTSAPDGTMAAEKGNPEMDRNDKKDASKLASDASAVSEDIAQLARDAVEAIRRVTDEFAAKAGVSKDDAVDAVKTAGKVAVNGMGSLASEARSITEGGLESIGKSVIRNPLAALTIAAGAGLLLGLLTRQDPRR